MKRKLLLFGALAFASFVGNAQYCGGGPYYYGDSNLASANIVGESTSISYTGCPAVTGVENQLGEVADLTLGSTYSANFTWGTCGGNYSKACSAWIDFDNNGTYDADEEIVAVAGYGTFGGSYGFTIPLDAVVGTTRMRVNVQEDGYLPLNPCASFYWGSIVEFTVELLPNCTDMDLVVGETELCEGDETMFDATSLTGGTVSWDGGVTNGVSFAPPAGTTVYTVTSSNPADCSYEVETMVNPYPEIEAAVSESVSCEGVGIIFTGSGGVSYDWDMGVTDGVAFTPGVGTDTYTVTGYDDLGCSNTATIDATVNPVPEVSASSSEDEICEGETITITLTGDADSYEWDPADITPGVPYAPADGVDTYTVTGTFDATGCFTTDVVTITLNPTPFVSASAGDGIFCDGQSLVLAAGGDADVKSWSPEDLTPGPGTYTYTVTGYYDGYEGCPASASVDLTVAGLPDVTATSDLDETCIGGSFVMTGAGAESYTWDMGVVDGVAYTPGSIGVGTYTVTGTDENGCVGSTSIDLEVVEGITIAATTVLETLGDDGEINITVTGGIPGYTYDWDNDEIGDFDDTEDLTGLSPGTYKVVVKGSTVCQATRTFIIGSQVGVEDLAIDEVTVYPNPTSNFVNIRLEGNFDYQLHSINGDVLLAGSAVNQKELRLEEFATGVYFITLSTDKGAVTMKVVKQ